MDTVEIRPATVADLDAVVDVHTRARTAYYLAGGANQDEFDVPGGHDRRRAEWASAFADAGKSVRVAVVDGELAGVVTFGPHRQPDLVDEPAAELFQLYVRPDRWGRGVGGRLHDEFVRYLRDSGLPVGLIEAWEHNTRAHRFYARHGWRPDGGRVPGPAGGDYLRMRLEGAEQADPHRRAEQSDLTSRRPALRRARG